jgi:triacylglycerol lipase
MSDRLRNAKRSTSAIRPMSSLPTLPFSLYSSNAFDAFVGAREFALGDARAQAWICQLAYETADHDKIKKVLALWRLALVDDDEGIIVNEVETVLPLTSTRCLVAAGRGATIVAFAGTDPLVLANWITDFDIHINRDTSAARGYSTAANAAWPRVKTLVNKSLGINRNVIITGHSLGGALAALIAQWLAADLANNNVQCVYTFGMPRVGDAAFATGYNAALGAHTYRLVYEDDIVPTVAPSELQFKHVGRYLHTDQSAKFDIRNLAPEFTSDAPPFVPGIAKQLARFLNSPLTVVMEPFDRLKLAAATLFGMGPPGVRTDPAGIAIELLPPVLRDHMLDRYIAALS